MLFSGYWAQWLEVDEGRRNPSGMGGSKCFYLFCVSFTDAFAYACALQRLTIDIDRRSFCCNIRPDTRRSPRPFCLDSPSGRRTISLGPWPEGTPRTCFADMLSARPSCRRNGRSRRRTHFFPRTCRFGNGNWTRRILEAITQARDQRQSRTAELMNYKSIETVRRHWKVFGGTHREH